MTFLLKVSCIAMLLSTLAVSQSVVDFTNLDGDFFKDQYEFLDNGKFKTKGGPAVQRWIVDGNDRVFEVSDGQGGWTEILTFKDLDGAGPGSSGSVTVGGVVAGEWSLPDILS